MKILIINSFDITGGAARAAYRLHKGLLKKNIDSQMLVQSKSSDDFTVIGPSSKSEKMMSVVRPILDSIPFRFVSKDCTSLFSQSWLPSGRLVKKINALNPDVVHLHWINAGMLKIEDYS